MVEQLKAADAIIFGCPTYMGSPSWQFKRFADASSRPWYVQEWKDKIAAGFTNSAGMNGDKFNTLVDLFTLAMQHSMIWVGTGIMPSNSKAASARPDSGVNSWAFSTKALPATSAGPSFRAASASG